MKLENTSVQMRKGILEYCVLTIVAQGEVYASDLLDRLRQAGFNVVEGTIYPLMSRLKNAGMVDYRWVESTGGPPRKYYTLTPLGQEMQQDLATTWNEISLAVETIKQVNN